MSYVEYKSLLSEIDRRLTQHDLQQLLDMCGLHGEAANILDARSLLRKLEEMEHLTIDELGGLGEVLETLGEFSLLGKLQQFQSKRKEYNDFLALISQALVSDERVRLEQLINICRRMALEDFEVDIVDVRTLFQELEKRRFLGFFRLLKAILTEIGREDLVRMVLEFEERRNNNYSFERNRARVVSLARDVGRRLRRVLNIKTVCRVASTGLVLFSFYELFNRLTTHEQLYNFFHDCVLPANTQLIDVSEGCVCFTVQAENIEGLFTLWNMYQDGKLKNHLFNFFVNDEMKTRAGGEENVELTVIIEKEEYNKVCTDESEGLQTFDQMKQRVKKALRISEEAFSVLTETSKEVKRRQTRLLELFESTEACLNMLSDKDYALLELGVTNLMNQLADHKQSLEREEDVVLIAGERDWKKSLLLSLILGEQLPPDNFLGTSSIICELRYGKTHKLVAHLKDADPETGLYSKTIQLSEMAGNPQQIFLQQISSFFPNQDLQDSVCDKVEIFWPNRLLKERIVIVDSPAFDKSPIVYEKVKVYLSEALAVICVIDSLGQQYRVEEPSKQSRKICFDQQREMSSTIPLFLCNNWDQVSKQEADSIKHRVVRALREEWPELDPDFQIIYISSPNATDGGLVVEEFALLMDAVKSSALQNIKATLQRQWRWLDFIISRMAYHMKMVMEFLCSPTDRKIVSDLHSERLFDVEKRLCSAEYELQEHFRKLADDAVGILSNHLQSYKVVEKFTSWTLDDIPHTGESWEVTDHFIQDAFRERLQNTIAAWEDENQILSRARTSMVQLSHQQFDESMRFLPFRYLENSVIADDDTGGPNICLTSNDFGAAQKVMIGVTSPIWVPVGLAVLVGSVPWIGTVSLTKKVTNMIDSRKYEKDKLGFIVQASREYLCNVAKEQQLWLFVEEQLKDVRVYLTQVSSRLREVIDADKMLCQQLRDEIRSGKEIKEFYGPLEEMSVRVKEKIALFFIKEVQSLEISHNDLKWFEDDQTSLLGNGASASVYRGTFRIPGQKEPTQVAVKLWNKELNESTAIGFLSKTEIFQKLDFHFIVKFFGTALLKKGDRFRVIHVMEICEENLMSRIFQNPENIPGMSVKTTAKKDVLCWAKDIAEAIEFIHSQGIVHRGLKLVKILLSQRNVVKVSGFRSPGEAKKITDTLEGNKAYLAPEVILYKECDDKADIYSFGIMLWEMWYGKTALLEEEGHVLDKVAKGARPSFVKGAMKPPTAWQDLMQRCWDGKPNNRPDAAECHKVLTRLSQKVYPQSP